MNTPQLGSGVVTSDSAGLWSTPAKVQTNEFVAAEDTKSLYHQTVIVWPRLAALLVEATLGARLETECQLQALPQDVQGRVTDAFPWRLPDSAGSWIYAEFSPPATAKLGLGQGKVVEARRLVIDAAEPAVAGSGGARLYVETPSGWLSFQTVVDRAAIDRYNAAVQGQLTSD